MPRTLLTADTIDPVAGKVTPTQNVPDQPNGNMFVATDKTILRVSNTNAATRTVTITVPSKPYGLTISSITQIVAATTGIWYFGPFPASIFAQPTGTDTGNVYVDITASTNVIYELVKLP